MVTDSQAGGLSRFVHFHIHSALKKYWVAIEHDTECELDVSRQRRNVIRESPPVLYIVLQLLRLLPSNWRTRQKLELKQTSASHGHSKQLSSSLKLTRGEWGESRTPSMCKRHPPVGPLASQLSPGGFHAGIFTIRSSSLVSNLDYDSRPAREKKITEKSCGLLHLHVGTRHLYAPRLN
jgi:hypothetical protein